MKRTYYIHIQLTEHVYATGTFDRLWKAGKFSKISEAMCLPTLIIDATALVSDANS